MRALLQRKGMIPPSQLWFSQVTEKFTGVVEAVLIECSGPIENACMLSCLSHVRLFVTP